MVERRCVLFGASQQVSLPAAALQAQAYMLPQQATH